MGGRRLIEWPLPAVLIGGGAQERASDHSLSLKGLNSGASNKSAFELQKQFPRAAAPGNAHCLLECS